MSVPTLEPISATIEYFGSESQGSFFYSCAGCDEAHSVRVDLLRGFSRFQVYAVRCPANPYGPLTDVSVDWDKAEKFFVTQSFNGF